jgi:hypothetical protein
MGVHCNCCSVCAVLCCTVATLVIIIIALPRANNSVPDMSTWCASILGHNVAIHKPAGSAVSANHPPISTDIRSSRQPNVGRFPQ